MLFISEVLNNFHQSSYIQVFFKMAADIDAWIFTSVIDYWLNIS